MKNCSRENSQQFQGNDMTAFINDKAVMSESFNLLPLFRASKFIINVYSGTLVRLRHECASGVYNS